MLKLAKESDFLQVYALMESAFPTDEHRPYEAQKALLARDNYRLYIEKDGDELVGIVALWTLSYPFIEHIAVSESRRNCGVGGRMLDEALSLCGGNACLEVELPETPIAVRRIGFYRRHGFCLNTYPYSQPPLAPGQSSVPLYIMTTPTPISEPEFQSLKTEIYRTAYK